MEMQLLFQFMQCTEFNLSEEKSSLIVSRKLPSCPVVILLHPTDTEGLVTETSRKPRRGMVYQARR